MGSVKKLKTPGKAPVRAKPRAQTQPTPPQGLPPDYAQQLYWWQVQQEQERIRQEQQAWQQYYYNLQCAQAYAAQQQQQQIYWQQNPPVPVSHGEPMGTTNPSSKPEPSIAPVSEEVSVEKPELISKPSASQDNEQGKETPISNESSKSPPASECESLNLPPELPTSSPASPDPASESLPESKVVPDPQPLISQPEELPEDIPPAAPALDDTPKSPPAPGDESLNLSPESPTSSPSSLDPALEPLPESKAVPDPQPPLSQPEVPPEDIPPVAPGSDDPPKSPAISEGKSLDLLPESPTSSPVSPDPAPESLPESKIVPEPQPPISQPEELPEDIPTATPLSDDTPKPPPASEGESLTLPPESPTSSPVSPDPTSEPLPESKVIPEPQPLISQPEGVDKGIPPAAPLSDDTPKSLPASDGESSESSTDSTLPAAPVPSPMPKQKSVSATKAPWDSRRKEPVKDAVSKSSSILISKQIVSPSTPSVTPAIPPQGSEDAYLDFRRIASAAGTAWIRMWRDFFRFSGKISFSDFWRTATVNILILSVLVSISAFFIYVSDILTFLAKDSLWNDYSLILLYEKLSLIARMISYGSFLVLFTYGLLIFVPMWALTCRRLRDTGRSALLSLVGFIPIVGGIILLVFLCRSSSSPEEKSKM